MALILSIAAFTARTDYPGCDSMKVEVDLT